MRKNLLFLITLLLVSIGLAASAILLVDYVRHAPVFCDPDGGCQAVKASPYAHPFGIPMPAFGVTGLFGIGLAALVPRPAARAVQAVLGGVSGIAGVLLLVVQGSMGVFCPFCVAVDVSSIGLAIVSILWLVIASDPPSGRLIPALSIATFVIAIGLPLGIGMLRTPKPLPGSAMNVGPIADAIAAAGDKVSVVDFADFECPFCRMTHAELAPLLAERKDKVKVVRKHVPLKMHAHALDAAKAGCCGETLGRGEEMADALFRTPPEELTPEGCEKLAREQGLDLERFRACVRDPATQARIDEDRETFRAVKAHGLPTIFIDSTALRGAQTREELAVALDAAIHARHL